MGRHSRRGSADKRDTADTTARQGSRGAPPEAGGAQRGPSVPGAGGGSGRVPAARPGVAPGAGQGGWSQGGGAGGPGGPGLGGPGGPGGRRVPGPPPARQGVPTGGAPTYGGRGFPDGTPAHGFPRLPDGTPAQGIPRLPDGTPAHGFPRLPDGTPARGVPRLPDGTPAQGVPRFVNGTPAHGTLVHGAPQARSGHPEQREPGGGWGELRGGPGVAYGAPGAAGAPTVTGVPLPRPRRGSPPNGPRQEYIDAFEGDVDVFAPRTSDAAHAADPYASVTDWDTEAGGRIGVANDTDDGDDFDDAPPTGEPVQAKGAKGRAFTGIAAAAVVTALAVVVAGQVTKGREGSDVQSQSAADQARDARDSASRGDGRPAPSAAPLTYEQKIGKRYALSPTLKGSGKFDAVPGIDRAPGTGQKFTYRVDVEQGLGLDGELFAQAVQKTLNDDRSWSHNGARTFERIYSGKPDFVITLASPGTTADWCAKSSLDTTVDNVSCDSAATERVMINAYRWAQGSETYGDRIHAYRQMLINHEVGHRLGYNHVTCDKDGDLAPVMQQQTKFLERNGIRCRANPWPYPGS
ncbi:DUF3152 domain-containing protein [Streptomyces regalis]|uniref:DUF3152 domain-containing protein n=1 Tax=Streptomyces regalis TaxID=68262 RepID=A0A101JBU3_9ACTN|nr:DUF3152 domain-containing protein [Streptomyces regalis]KUL23897.1 hypothetical protein ADL12_38540 [Streptomyces regalis]